MPSRLITAQLAGMRKPQTFVVYPRADDRSPVVVQSERAIGRFDPFTREGILNWRGPKAKYFHHLSPALGAEPFTFPAEFVAQAVSNEPLPGEEVGPGIYVRGA